MEGLRVCEDIVRFSFPDAGLALALKELRHKLRGASDAFPREMLLWARDVSHDDQKFRDTDGERVRSGIAGIAGANLHRAMEAVRTLEEFAKLLSPSRGENLFQEVRFALYEIEKAFVPLLLRAGVLGKFRLSLYAIVDSSFVRDGDYAGTALRFIDGGAAVIQLRMKTAERRLVLNTARILSSICRERGVLFIVNDHPDIALIAGADGVHLGQDDIPVRDVRAILPPHMIIGISTHSYEQAVAALNDGPDYIAIGPIFGTSTKQGALLEGIGTRVIADIRKTAGLHIVAIGGITPEGAVELIAAGCDSVAVISYLYRDNDYEGNCGRMIQAVKQAGGQ